MHFACIQQVAQCVVYSSVRCVFKGFFVAARQFCQFPKCLRHVVMVALGITLGQKSHRDGVVGPIITIIQALILSCPKTPSLSDLICWHNPISTITASRWDSFLFIIITSQKDFTKPPASFTNCLNFDFFDFMMDFEILLFST